MVCRAKLNFAESRARSRSEGAASFARQRRQGTSVDLPSATNYHSGRLPIMPLTIDTREVSHITILDIHGRIILGPEIGTLRTAVHDLVTEGKKKIILNLADVDYIDSSSVGERVNCFNTVRNAGGELKLPHPKSPGRPPRQQAQHRFDIHWAKTKNSRRSNPSTTSSPNDQSCVSSLGANPGSWLVVLCCQLISWRSKPPIPKCQGSPPTWLLPSRKPKLDSCLRCYGQLPETRKANM